MDSDTTTRVGDHARILADVRRTKATCWSARRWSPRGSIFRRSRWSASSPPISACISPDFRAAERSFALIAQVCGRSGRTRPGEAIVQTYAPDHPAIRFAAAHDYEGFAETELAERAAAGFPPAARLIYLGVIGRDRRRVEQTAQTIRRPACGRANVADVSGPAPYPIARVNDEWRYRVALRGRNPAELRAFVRERFSLARATDRVTRLAINVDP